MTELNQLRESSGGEQSLPDETAFAAPSSRPLELVVGAVALGLSLLALYLSQNIHVRMGGGGVDPKWWPTALSIAASILSLCMLIVAFVRPDDRSDMLQATLDGWKRVVIGLALTSAYVFGWWQFGYVVPTALFLFALLWLFGVRNWKPLILYPVITTAFIYALFQLLLRVPL